MPIAQARCRGPNPADSTANAVGKTSADPAPWTARAATSTPTSGASAHASEASVNSALQVDLTGQVNAESRDGVHIGAVGGAVDFVRAAARSPNGASIIALQSTTSRGESRIVRTLDIRGPTGPSAAPGDADQALLRRADRPHHA